jgi:ABC-type bacteriocin/lantibiotic exporter with double-glycine peptidase domain
MVEFEEYTATWTEQQQEAEGQGGSEMALGETPPCFSKEDLLALQDISLAFEDKKLTCITGKIGSGKSSLLMAILQELPRCRGQLRLRRGLRLGLVEQEPFIFSGTLKENILFYMPMDQAKFERACALADLTTDLEGMPLGIESEIGERGINLSGGQKARLSMARAFYSEAELYLLDDPLSALDAKVNRKIFGSIREHLKDSCTILNTHQVQFVEECDHAVVLEAGRVLKQGSPKELSGVLEGVQAARQEDHENKDRMQMQMSEDNEVLASSFEALWLYIKECEYPVLPVLIAVCTVLNVATYLALQRTFTNYDRLASPPESANGLFLAAGLFILCNIVF